MNSKCTAGVVACDDRRLCQHSKCDSDLTSERSQCDTSVSLSVGAVLSCPYNAVINKIYHYTVPLLSSSGLNFPKGQRSWAHFQELDDPVCSDGKWSLEVSSSSIFQPLSDLTPFDGKLEGQPASREHC